ncbi:MAG: HD domain-containing phosphohydrolase [Solirubrobacteraceae bacterium]
MPHPPDSHRARAPVEGRAIERLRVVVLDDREANVALLKALLSTWGFTNVVGLTSAAACVERCRLEPPDLLLLDVALPDADGLTVLGELASQIRAPVALPVLVLTDQQGPGSKHQALELGARDFLVKPFDPDEVHLRVRNALQLRALQLEQRELQRDLARSVEERTAELEAARLDVVERLARAGEFRDDATGEHTRRVGTTVALLGHRCGADEDTVRRFELAAPLHDIGKLALPDSILLKPGPLTPEEFKRMERHTQTGAELLAGGSSELLELAAEIALTHHERWDGRGYPHGLAGAAIPLSGRLTAIADVFDALTHARPYKPAWTVAEALEEMSAQAGTQFDPDALREFLRLDHETLI